MEAQYSIALCESCSNGQYTLNTGEVLRWSVAESECTAMIRNTQSGELVELEPQEGAGEELFLTTCIMRLRSGPTYSYQLLSHYCIHKPKKTCMHICKVIPTACGFVYCIIHDLSIVI